MRDDVKELADLLNTSGSDKHCLHNYAYVYAWLLKDLRDVDGLRLLEIGVSRGCSLRVWEKYLPKAEIIGIDKRATCAMHVFDRARVVIGDAANKETTADLGDFDIVIDDGAHYTNEQMATFDILWPRTKRIYFMEDLMVDRNGETFRLAARRLKFEMGIEECATKPPSCHTIFSGSMMALVRFDK